MTDYFAPFYVMEDKEIRAWGTVRGTKGEIKDMKNDTDIIKKGIREMAEHLREYAEKPINVDTTILYESDEQITPLNVPYLGTIESP